MISRAMKEAGKRAFLHHGHLYDNPALVERIVEDVYTAMVKVQKRRTERMRDDNLIGTLEGLDGLTSAQVMDRIDWQDRTHAGITRLSVNMKLAGYARKQVIRDEKVVRVWRNKVDKFQE